MSKTRFRDSVVQAAIRAGTYTSDLHWTADGRDPVTCDDCGREYPAPVYYSFPVESCTIDGQLHHIALCTGNICPSCAGPDLDPDVLNDMRRPKE